MSLLKRVGSLKRSTNTYVVPRRAEPDNAERPKGMIRCHTTLLDDAVFTCDIDVSYELKDADIATWFNTFMRKLMLY